MKAGALRNREIGVGLVFVICLVLIMIVDCDFCIYIWNLIVVVEFGFRVELVLCQKANTIIR